MRNPFHLKVGLALGGGAARGVAHVGVLRALERGAGADPHRRRDEHGRDHRRRLRRARATSTRSSATVRAVLGSEEFQQQPAQRSSRRPSASKGRLFFSVANLVRRGIFFGVSNLRESFLSAEEIARSLEAIMPDVEHRGAVRCRSARWPSTSQSAEEVVLRSGEPAPGGRGQLGDPRHPAAGAGSTSGC